MTLHRTYLRDGGKLAALDAKRCSRPGSTAPRSACSMRPRNWRSAKVSRPASPLSGDRQTGLGRLNAGNLEKLWLPDTVRKVCIYADNDADGDFAGQAFAFALARRLKRKKNSGRRQVRVFLPGMPAPIGPTSGANAWKPRRRVRHECLMRVRPVGCTRLFSGTASGGDGEKALCLPHW